MEEEKKFDIVQELMKIISRKDEEIKKYKVEWDKAQEMKQEEEDYNERMYLEHLQENMVEVHSKWIGNENAEVATEIDKLKDN